jgi:hypothetical protein
VTNGDKTQVNDKRGCCAVLTVDGAAGFEIWITDDDAGRPPASVTLDGAVPEDEPLPEGVFHLLVADDDLYNRALRGRPTLCGAWVQPAQLPPSYDKDWESPCPRYCRECVKEAVRLGAAAGDAS